MISTNFVRSVSPNFTDKISTPGVRYRFSPSTNNRVPRGPRLGVKLVILGGGMAVTLNAFALTALVDADVTARQGVLHRFAIQGYAQHLRTPIKIRSAYFHHRSCWSCQRSDARNRRAQIGVRGSS